MKLSQSVNYALLGFWLGMWGKYTWAEWQFYVYIIGALMLAIRIENTERRD